MQKSFFNETEETHSAGRQPRKGIHRWKTSRRALSCLGIVILTVNAVHAVHAAAPSLVKFSNLSTNNGLPRQSIRAIDQSPEGIMWFGIESSGLCRYDGQTFELFSEYSPAGSNLSDDHVEAIYADDKRNIWIGTHKGLNRLQRDTGKIDWYQHKENDFESIRNDRVWALEMDDQDRLWIGTSEGLCYLDPETQRFVSVTPPPSVAPARIRDLLIDRKGRLWVMTVKETYKIDPDTLAATLLPYDQNDLVPRETYCGTEDLTGRLWFSTYSGHYVYDPNDETIRHVPIIDENGELKAGGGAVAATDPQGRIWFATFAEGFFIIDPDTEKVLVRDQLEVLKGDRQTISSRAMKVDSDGRVWIGTKFHGLVLYHPQMETFVHWPAHNFTKEPDGITSILSVATSQDGTVWVGTHREGITRLDPDSGNVQHYDIDSLDDRAQSLEILPNGNILYAGINGVGSINPQTGETKYELINTINDIQAMPDGQIWLGSKNGLYSLDLETFTAKPLHNWTAAVNAKLSATDCKALHLDPDGFLWIASRQEAIYRLDPTRGTLINLEELAANDPHSISEGRSFLTGSRGQLWIATKSSGLVQFDPKSRKLRIFTPSNGLPTKTIFGVLEDPEGAIWISTDQGICRLDPITENVSYFGTQHGLQADIFEPNAQAFGVNGLLYFGGPNGLNAFRPSDVSSIRQGNRLIFTEIIVGNQVRGRDQNTPPALKLAHKENQVMISFSLLDYSSHARNLYAYRMSGLNENWIEIGTRQTVSFNYLPPGDYTLEVRAHIPGTTWSDSSPYKSLSLAIAAPYWQTWPFRIAVFSLISLSILGVILGIHFRSKAQRKKLEDTVKERTQELTTANEKLTAQKSEIEESRRAIAQSRDNLEELVAERTSDLEKAKQKAEESDQLKSAFLANMSHEIRTPMNAIIGFSDIIVQDEYSKEERLSFTKIIRSSCASLAALINDILDLSTIEAGQIKISKRDFDLNEMLDELSESLSLQLAEKESGKIELRMHKPSPDCPSTIYSDPVRLRQIISNLVNNAIKFTAQGYVSVKCTLEAEHDTFRFTVKDTGIGIAKSHLHEIWERFRKIEDDNSTLFRGTGLGLAITKNLVELLGGEINVKSEEGKGSVFTFTIPRSEQSKPREIEDETNESTQDKEDATQPPENLPTILVAEDEDSNYICLYHQIPKGRAHIIRANNGQEAIDICQREGQKIDLIFMDIKMPYLDGKQAANRIKKFAPTIPIIANTAYATNEERAEIMSHSFDHYMSKPNSTETIRKLIDQYLS